MNFLIVDDNRLLCKFITQYLKSKGENAKWISNPRITLDKLLEEQFDVVILDIGMPVMDGYQVLEVIREKKEFDHIKVIIFTGLGYDEEAMQKMRRLGAHGYISKGLSPTEIYNAIMRISNHPSSAS